MLNAKTIIIAIAAISTVSFASSAMAGQSETISFKGIVHEIPQTQSTPKAAFEVKETYKLHSQDLQKFSMQQQKIQNAGGMTGAKARLEATRARLNKQMGR